MKVLNSIVTSIKKNFNERKMALHEPLINTADYRIILNSLKEKQISTYGVYNKIFEKKISKYVRNKNIVSLINGTSALHLMLKILGVDKNEEVLVQSLTYVSSVNCIIYNNANPHFVEIDKSNLGVNIEKLDAYLAKNTHQKKGYCINKKIKKKIRFLLNVYINGLSSDVIKLKQTLKKYNINLIEDAAEALGCFFKGKHLGLFGEAGIFSFNGNKIISTGGGGALFMRSKKKFDLSFKFATNCKINKSFDVEYFDVGYNYRLPSLNASLGISQLKRLELFIKKKKKIFELYKKIFENFEDFEMLKPIKNLRSNYWLNNVRVKNSKLIEKDRFIKSLNNSNIFARKIWKPIHLMKRYSKYPSMNLSETEKAYKEIFSLPSSEFLIK